MLYAMARMHKRKLTVPDYSRRAVQPFSRTALATPLSVMTSSYRSSLS